MSSEDGQKGEQWGSRLGVILAVAGSAVGLGNFLRFPGQAAQNGGGAFMLPYFMSLFVLGIPHVLGRVDHGPLWRWQGLQFGTGHLLGDLAEQARRDIFGALALLIPLVIYMYYVLIEAWCLGYA